MHRSTLVLLTLLSKLRHAFAFVPARVSLADISPSSHRVVLSPNTLHYSSQPIGGTSTTSLQSLPYALTNLPSILATEEIPEYQTANAFQDTVTLTDLTSDPFLRTAFLLTAVAIAALFIAKSIVTQMDEAVQKTAIDFDRVMKTKYSKKWVDIIKMEEELEGDDVAIKEEKEGDRIQRIVEEMERLTKEEPEFFERVMRDVERQV